MTVTVSMNIQYMNPDGSLTYEGMNLWQDAIDEIAAAGGSVGFTDLEAALVVTEAEGIASNDNDTTLPTSAAVKDYVDDTALGVGQTWQDLTASRAASTSYQNLTGRPIAVAIVAISSAATARNIQASSDNATWVNVGLAPGSANSRVPSSFVVPNNWYYRVDGALDANFTWAELR